MDDPLVAKRTKVLPLEFLKTNKQLRAALKIANQELVELRKENARIKAENDAFVLESVTNKLLGKENGAIREPGAIGAALGASIGTALYNNFVRKPK